MVCLHFSGAGMKQQTVSETILHDVCLPLGRVEHVSRGNLSAIIHGVGSLERCRKKLLPLLNVSQCSSGAVNCVSDSFQRPSVGFINGKFYGFSEFYYTMEDILRMGGKYNSVRFQLAAQVQYVRVQCSLLVSNV